ncbi:ABC transporter permease [Georgenia sp. SUBG003]|uniref:ABC transporter permease n=1 Tax=Georgenia sp. SUBG003 TaxID=1497974 RepID=UPI003AB59B87
MAHKLRLALSGLAVVLGVAFVAGTLVFTDTLSRTFTALFESTTADVNVTAASAFDSQGPGMASTVLLPESLVAEAETVDGVAAVAGYVQSEGVYVVGPDGKVVATGGAPGVGVGWDDDEMLGMTLAEGRAPRADDEVVLDETTAEKTGYGVGDRVDVLTPGPRVEATVVGVLRFGESGGLAGASLTAFEHTTAQELLARPGTVHGLSVEAADGVDDAVLAERIEEALGAGYDVTTRTEEVDAQKELLEGQLSFINIFLMVFAGVALFVGSFIILNTFAILVAQRTRELALLRALGAGRGQVTRVVLAEALVLGLVGSTVGLFAGLGIAAGLRAAFGTFGLTLDGGLVVERDGRRLLRDRRPRHPRRRVPAGPPRREGATVTTPAAAPRLALVPQRHPQPRARPCPGSHARRRRSHSPRDARHQGPQREGHQRRDGQLRHRDRGLRSLGDRASRVHVRRPDRPARRGRSPAAHQSPVRGSGRPARLDRRHLLRAGRGQVDDGDQPGRRAR